MLIISNIIAFVCGILVVFAYNTRKAEQIRSRFRVVDRLDTDQYYKPGDVTLRYTCVLTKNGETFIKYEKQ